MNERRLDPGLQPERTRLAWRRALLTLVGGVLVLLRLLPSLLGTWALGVGLAGLVACGVLGALAVRRGRRTRRALNASGPLPGGGLLFGAALVVVTIAAFGALGVALVPR